MSEPESKELIALVLMVDQYLGDGILDSLAERAGEMALQVLADHGLVTFQGSSRFAKWTDAGKLLVMSQRRRNRT